MKITHISNSFIKVKLNGSVVICDPWVGIANHGGWHSFPEFLNSDLLALCDDVDYVYISHLHSDHFDPSFLNKANLIGKKYIIKKFNNGILKNRLQKLGVDSITELSEFNKFSLGYGDSLAIIPQITSNSSGLEDAVNYDLDTSIVFSDGLNVFFNQVDNPLSVGDFEAVHNFISQEFGEISVAALTCGAAGEYPQCFRGIDRGSEMKRIISSSLIDLKNAIQILKPKITFMAGGTYFIPGRAHMLNRFIAQPNFEEIQLLIGAKTNLVSLEGGKTLSLASMNSSCIVDRDLNALRELDDSIRFHRSDLYPYEHDVPPSIEEFHHAFRLAEKNYRKKITELGLSIRLNINFDLYSGLIFDEDLNILQSPITNCVLQIGEPSGIERLTIHIDLRAMYGCLKRVNNWNQMLSGSLCLFERVPNIHRPDVLFSLNYLVN
jgi:UDP-MurNAc hydroxylase